VLRIDAPRRMELRGSLALPNRKSSIPPSNHPKPSVRPFRQRYDELEAQRVQLLKRLEKLGDAGRKHSGFHSALSLLNVQFRRAKLVQRAAVLQSAAWMIDLLERIAMML
jgi:hypothetical protein